MTKREAKSKYTRVVKMGDKWTAYLQIDHQGFTIVDNTSKNRANWYADMVAAALARLVDNETKEQP